MRAWTVVVAVLACAGGFGARAEEPAPTCDQGGSVLFYCPVSKGREVKVCGAKGDAPWIRYTFGKPGAPDLSFPATQGLEGLRYEARTHVRSMGDVLAFENNGVTYEVAQMIGGGGPDGEMNNFSGVMVTQGVKLLATVPCAKEPVADWETIRALLAR